MLLKQKNELFKIIVEADLKPSKFKISEKGDIAHITHKESKLEFGFRYLDNPDRISYGYRAFTPSKKWITPGVVTFTQVKKHFKDWLEYHVKISIDDSLEDHDLWNSILWSKIEKISGISSKKTDKNNFKNFTITEKKLIDKALKDFQKLLEENFELKRSTIKEIKNDLDYLRKAKDKLNKRDWKIIGQKMIYDIGINIAANLTVNTASGMMSIQIPELFWALVRTAFQITSAPRLCWCSSPTKFFYYL